MDSPQETGQLGHPTADPWAKLHDDVYTNPQEFSRLLSANFSKLDLNGDGIITRAELDARASAAPTSQIGKVAATALKHFDDIAKLSGDLAPLGIYKDDATELQKDTDAAQCAVPEPSLVETMAAGSAGGAIGGGVSAKMGGDKFSSGAGKGAAVGAAIGGLVYAVQESNYKQAAQKRQRLDSWSEFQGSICGDAKPGVKAVGSATAQPDNSHLDQNMAVVHNIVAKLDTAHAKASQDHVLARLQSLKQDFGVIDTNHDGFLSLDELARAAASPSLPEADRQMAAIVADNIGTVARLSGTGEYSGVRVSRADLDAGAKLYAQPDQFDVYMRRAKVGGGVLGGAAAGCAVGAAIGALAASPEIGCPIGAVIAALGGGFVVDKTANPADTLGDALGRDQVDKLRAQLGAIQ